MDRDYFISWSRQAAPTTFEVNRAEHDEYVLADGRRVFDFLSTSFQASFGHSNSRIIEGISAQLRRMPLASPKADFELKRGVSRRLIERLDVGPGKLFFTVSGAESVENALKIARNFTGRPIVLARRKSYHGASLGAMSVSGDWRSEGHLTFAAGTVRIPEPDEDGHGMATRRIIEEAGPRNVAAVIVETISGVNGVVIPPAEWWQAIQGLCREYGILLISDEVLCGFGRTGADFAIHHFGVRPDLVCLSKAISGGYIPLGAVWVSERVARRYDDEILACGLTSYAHPLGLAALDAVLDLLADDGVIAHRRKLESLFSRWLGRMADRPSVRAVRHRGMLAALDFQGAAPGWVDLLEAGVYAYSKGDRLVLAPPLTADAGRLERAMQGVEAVLQRGGVED